MDHLVDKITETVIALLSEKQSQQKATSNHLRPISLIILLDGYPYTQEEMHKTIVQLISYSPNSFFLMTKNLELRFSSLIPHDSIVPFPHHEKMENAYLKSHHIFVPFFPLSEIGKIALLTTSDSAAKLISRGLEEHKPVYALVNINNSSYPEPLKSQLIEYLKQLETRGLRLLSWKEYEKLFLLKNESYDNKSNNQSGHYALQAPNNHLQAPHEPCSLTTGECNACGHCPNKLQEAVERILGTGASRIGATLGTAPIVEEVAKYIDHTLLKSDATKDDIIKLCQEARKFNFASVCVNPSHVTIASEELKETKVKVCTVVGFPLGATTTIAKVMETRDAIANGAEEIDMVINVGAIKAKQWDIVRDDIEAVRKASEGYVLKVILETALLTDPEKIKACEIAKETGANFVKTSTGFGPGGATEHDVALMRQVVGTQMGVKASGGIRDYETAQKMIKAGATRIGASASVAIVQKANAAIVQKKSVAIVPKENVAIVPKENVTIVPKETPKVKGY